MQNPTDAQVEAAARAVHDELKNLVKEIGPDALSISPANHRLIRAALTAAAQVSEAERQIGDKVSWGDIQRELADGRRQATAVADAAINRRFASSNDLADRIEKWMLDYAQNGEGQIFDLYPEHQPAVITALRAAAQVGGGEGIARYSDGHWSTYTGNSGKNYVTVFEAKRTDPA